MRSRVLVLNLVSKLLYKLLSSHIHNPGLDLWSEQIADLLLLFFRKKKKCKQQPNKHVLGSTLGETISRSEHFQDDLLLNCGLGPIRRMRMLDQSFGERNLKTEICLDQVVSTIHLPFHTHRKSPYTVKIIGLIVHQHFNAIAMISRFSGLSADLKFFLFKKHKHFGFINLYEK